MYLIDHQLQLKMLHIALLSFVINIFKWLFATPWSPWFKQSERWRRDHKEVLNFTITQSRKLLARCYHIITYTQLRLLTIITNGKHWSWTKMKKRKLQESRTSSKIAVSTENINSILSRNPHSNEWYIYIVSKHLKTNEKAKKLAHTKGGKP